MGKIVFKEQNKTKNDFRGQHKDCDYCGRKMDADQQYGDWYQREKK